MKPAVSIIMPHYNDVETTIGTIDSIYETIDIDNFEVIVICDGGERVPAKYLNRPMLNYVEHFFNVGVGQAFDTGVRLAKSDNLILMGADIRFEKNGWAERMIKVVDGNPTSLICTVCGSTKTDTKYYGADVIFLVANKDITDRHPRKHIKDYRSVLEGKWRPQTGRGVYSVPSLMGAFYGVKKAWYEKVRGFNLHYLWGSLEPYISLKSYLMGGDVKVDSENITYHMFHRGPQRAPRFDALAYNQFLVSAVVFDKYGKKYADYLLEGQDEAVKEGGKLYMQKIQSIDALTFEFRQSRRIEPQDLEKMMVEMSYHYQQPKNKYTNPLI